METFHLAYLYTRKIINMSVRATGSYEVQKHNFIKNHWKDEEYDYKLVETIEGHEAHTLIVNPERGGWPWYTNTFLLILLDLIAFGYPLRFLTEKNNVNVDFTIEKYIVA